MATPRKKWPQECEYARLDSIALANEGDRILDGLLDELVEIDQVRKVGRVIANLKDIRFKLTVCKDGETKIEEKNK
jgi:hypothetical protein